MSPFTSGMRHDETAANKKAAPISIDVLGRILMDERV
jgi:hypothetical protein